MVAVSAFSPISPEDYLAAEATSSTKHEYRDGHLYAMAGGTDAHITIALNLWALLRSHLRNRGYRAYALDMKAHIEDLSCFYYPDVMVTCDDRDLAASTLKRYPCLIVEVLSDRTEAFDRGDKFTDYRHLASLQEYVVVCQSRPQVEVFRRNAEGLWVLYCFSAGERVVLTSIGWEGAIADLYEEVNLSEPGTATAGNQDVKADAEATRD